MIFDTSSKWKSILLFLQIWLGAISAIVCYPVIAAFMLLSYTIIRDGVNSKMETKFPVQEK